MSVVKYKINLVPENELRPSKKWPLVVAAGVVVLGAILALPLYAADTMPVSALEARSAAKVSGADTLKPGRFAVGLAIHTADSPLPGKVISDSEESKDSRRLSERVHQTAVILGYGVAKFLQIDLGVRAIHESISGEYDAALFSDSASEDPSSEQDDRSETAFSGASLLAKFKVLNLRELKIGIAPFVESGAGKDAQQSIARSEKTKGGWMLTTSYLAPGVMGINLNGGYRYREREQIGRYSLRNEAFYQGSIDAYIHKRFIVFVAGQGRSLMIADESERLNGEKRSYEAFESGEVSAGFTLKSRKMHLSLYGGTKLKDEAIGSGQWNAGANIAYVFGKKRRSTAPASSPVIAKKKDEKPTDVAEQAPTQAKDSEKPAEKKPEIKEADKSSVDFNEWQNVKLGEELSDDPEDYKALKKKLSDESKAPAPADKMTEQEKAEQELEQLQQAEEARKEAKEKQRLEEENRIRAEKRANQESDAKRYQKIRREVLEEAGDDLPEFNDEDVNWDGLN